MKMFMAVAAAAVLFGAAQAQASFAGKYTGTGKVYDSTGFKQNCESMKVEVAQTASTLKISADFKCGGMALANPGGELDIKGGELFKKGQKVGTISADSVTINQKEGDTVMKTTAKLKGNTLTFKFETTSPARPGVTITYEGTVKR